MKSSAFHDGRRSRPRSPQANERRRAWGAQAKTGSGRVRNLVPRAFKARSGLNHPVIFRTQNNQTKTENKKED
jgi:hypothetical protein